MKAKIGALEKRLKKQLNYIHHNNVKFVILTIICIYEVNVQKQKQHEAEKI